MSLLNRLSNGTKQCLLGSFAEEGEELWSMFGPVKSEWTGVTDAEAAERLSKLPEVEKAKRGFGKEGEVVKYILKEKDMGGDFKEYMVLAEVPGEEPKEIFKDMMPDLAKHDPFVAGGYSGRPLITEHPVDKQIFEDAMKRRQETEFEVDDVQTFADLADTFDKLGFYRAADKVDRFVKECIAKRDDPNRLVAKHIRNQKRNNIKVAEVDVSALAQRLRLDPNVLKQLNQQQLQYINRIRNTSIARQWITRFQQQRPQRMPTQPQKPQQLPTQPPKPQQQPVQPGQQRAQQQPASQQPQQPRQKRWTPPTQQQRGQEPNWMPQALTKQDMPQELTKKDFPQEIDPSEFGG
jgi:hypothetical protein